VFHMFIAGVVLPYYWVMWTPAWLALTAIGVHDLARVAARHLPRPARATWAAALGVPVAALGVFGVPAVAASVRLATQPLTGPQRLPAVMRNAQLRGGIVGGIPAWQFWDANLPGHVSYGMPNDLNKYDTVAVGGSCGDRVPAVVRALIDVNIGSDDLHLVYRDPKITVYGASHSLRSPTQAQVNAEPVGSPSDDC
jgi:hypothetical protein